MKPVQRSQCRTCIFRHDGNQVQLRPGRLAEIESYLVEGTAHLCHTNARKACRGGRDWQLTIWHRLGILPEPTDAALAEAMRKSGADPGA